MGPTPDRAQLEAAIEAQEGLRATLGDAVVDATIEVLRAKLAEFEEVPRSRKLLTVMFVDIVGSTRLLHGRDPEETMAVLDAALSRLAGAVADHAGRVTRFMGDGFLAIFGLPRARENDPERAVRAGLAILADAQRIAVELEETHSLDGFSVRIGVSTGLVVAGGRTEAADTIMGDTVTLAARLEQAAPPGGMLISVATQRHVRGRFTIEDAGHVEAKGFGEPVAAYLVTGAAEQAVVGGEGFPLVGRERELGRLVALLHSSPGDPITILGDAGIGKSRLLEEAIGSLPADVPVLRGFVRVERGDVPFDLIASLLLERAGQLGMDGDSAERCLAALHADGIPRDGAESVVRLVGLAPAATGDPTLNLQRATRHLVEWIGRLGARSGLVLAVEDLHWADVASLELLEVLTRSLVESGGVMVATARKDLLVTRPEWGVGHEWMHLDALSRSDAVAQIEALAGAPAGSGGPLADRIAEMSGGNPFHAGELFRMVVDEGLVGEGVTLGSISPELLDTARVPPTMAGVVQARIEAMPSAHQRVLEVAALIGGVFWDVMLGDLLGVSEQDLDGALSELMFREMVYLRHPSSLDGATEYGFQHEVTRSVAYDGMLRDRRTSLHGAVADWLGDRMERPSGEFSGVRAVHLERAGRTAEAVDCYVDAARAALGGSALTNADDFVTRGLALVGDDGDRTFSLLSVREEVLGRRGQWDERARTLEELLGLADGDPAKTAHVRMGQTWLHYYRGEMSEAEAVARMAVEAAADTDDPALQASAGVALLWSRWGSHSAAVAVSEAEGLLSLAMRAGDEEVVGDVRNLLGLLLLQIREFSGARRHLEANLASAQAAADLRTESKSLNNLAVAEVGLGRYADARAHFTRFKEIADEIGDEVSSTMARTNLLWVTVCEEEWDAALDAAPGVLADQERIGHKDAVAETLMWFGHAALGAGDALKALELYGRAQDLRREIGQGALLVGAAAGVAHAALEAGQEDVAREWATRVSEAIDRDPELTGAWEPLRIHLRCALVFEALGEPDAEHILSRAREMVRQQAARIDDPEDRRTFLERVPWNRELLEA